MAVFLPDDSERLDYQVLAQGGVALYFQHEILAEDIAWLALERYEVAQFDEEALDSVEGLHFEARLKLDFPQSYEPSPDHFRDALRVLSVPPDGGIALVLPGVERIAADDRDGLIALVEVIRHLSHERALRGERFLALLQSDDPELDLGSLGAQPLPWNAREAQAWTRGL